MLLKHSDTWDCWCCIQVPLSSDRYGSSSFDSYSSAQSWRRFVSLKFRLVSKMSNWCQQRKAFSPSTGSLFLPVWCSVCSLAAARWKPTVRLDMTPFFQLLKPKTGPKWGREAGRADAAGILNGSLIDAENHKHSWTHSAAHSSVWILKLVLCRNFVCLLRKFCFSIITV